ncbi:hypothetical protein JL721_12703 [Aureococcus anophagefferens]|nr:hypothetical protein JL721_12703 [Aureococcus anophagefferens]
MGVQDFNDWFCIPAFFVLFRETLEAAVLVAVLIQYLNRADAKHLKRQVWLGAAVGGAASVAIGVVILSIYYTQKSTMTTAAAFVVDARPACVVITYFLVTHLAPGMKSSGSWQVKWERNMDELVQAQIDKTNEYGFFTLSFTSVLREGFEAAIFVVGFGAAYRPESMPIPIVTGIFAGVAFGASMFVGTNKMDLSLFFKFSAGFLALIAAGLGSHASYEFQKGEAFGAWACKRICDDVWVPAVQAPFGTYASYVPYTDIAPHAAIDLDMRAFSDRMQAEDWDGAWEIYDQGGNSAKGDGFRTLRGFSKDLSGEPTYDEFLAYHGNAKYADDYVRAVMWDRLSDNSTAKLDPRPELFSTNTLSWDMAFQMALKAAQYQSTWMYSLHELYSALGKCEAGDVGPEGAPHAWDEGWAFYVGSIPGETGSPFGSLSYALPDMRCNAWNYCADDAGRPAWREAGDGANSDVSARMLRLYRAGLAAVRDETRCAEARTYVDKILACGGGSLGDEVAYYDGLEEIGARPDGDWEEENCDDDEADASWHSYRRLEAEPWYDALVEQVPEAYGRKLVTERAKSCDGKGQSIAWPNEEVWDITGCCDTKNGFFFLMMVLFWYRPAITNLELIIWVIYWPIIAFWGWYKVRDITDFNAELQAAADAKGEEDLKPEAEWARPAPRPADAA